MKKQDGKVIKMINMDKRRKKRKKVKNRAKHIPLVSQVEQAF